MSQRILVVDDKEIVRSLRAYLEKAGHLVLIAYDGESALHIIRSDRHLLRDLPGQLSGRLETDRGAEL